MKKCLIAAMIAVAGLASLAAAGAHAQDALPPQIKIIVPFPAGGPTDVFGRHIAQALGDHLKATVIVENRPGANGTIGADAVARSAPDGGTLLFNATHQAIMPALMKSIPYETKKAFTPVALAATRRCILARADTRHIGQISRCKDHRIEAASHCIGMHTRQSEPRTRSTPDARQRVSP
jgi:tripartite-type tricarboxylate transporter receptor subunit TctC